MFSNLKIGTRLALGFGMILLFLVTVGATGYWSLEKMESEIISLSEKSAKLVELAQRSRGTINIMRRYEKDLFMNIGDVAKVEDYRKKWTDALDQFRQGTNEMIKLLDEQKDKDTVAAINGYTSTYAEGFAKVYGKIKSEEIKTPQDANKSIGAFKEATHQSESLTNELAAKLDNKSNAKVAEVVLNCNAEQLYMLVLPGIAIVLTFLLAVFLTRSITIPVNKTAAQVATMAGGDFTTQLDINQKDEIGMMANSLNSMSDQLGAMIKDVIDVVAKLSSSSNDLANVST